jgi:hypothetical protein
MAKRKSTKGQTTIYKHTHKDRVIRTGVNSRDLFIGIVEIPWYLCIAFHDEASYGTTPCFLPCFASLRIVHFWLPLRYSLTFILKCYWEIIRHFITIYLKSVIRVDINDIRTENKICKLKCNKAITALHCVRYDVLWNT